MDSRDIKEEPKPIADSKYLETLYGLQKELLDNYIKIEGLPMYPLDINTKKSQIILKDFVGRVIEELAEGYESLLAVDELTQKNELWVNEINEVDYIQTLNHLQNAGEEIADSLHFMLELLIYSNIQPKDIDNFIEKYIKYQHHPITTNGSEVKEYWYQLSEQNILRKAIVVGTNMMYDKLPIDLESNLKKTVDLVQDIIDDYEDSYEFIHKHVLDIRYLSCGRYYSHELYYSYKYMLWEVTYWLNIARNFLKNKPWKQSQMMTNESGYQEAIIMAFLSMMGLFFNLGLVDSDIYFLYWKKNKVNQFRIKSNY